VADSSHNDYVDDDYVDDYIEDTGLVAAPTVVDIDVGAPGQAKHRTALASENNLDAVYWSASSPWAPYDVQSIFAVWNHLGIYAFSKTILPESIQSAVFHCDTTLISVGSVTFAAEPIATNLLGSVSAGRRPTGLAILSNTTGWWNDKINNEAWLCMGAGHFFLIKGQFTIPQLVGTVGSITLTEEGTVEIEYGDFPTDHPPACEKIWFVP
jgi:hypothetical protein